MNSASGSPNFSPNWISNNNNSNSNNKKLNASSSGLSKQRDNVIKPNNPSTSPKILPSVPMAMERA